MTGWSALRSPDVGVFFSCKHFPQTSLRAMRWSKSSGAISLRFDNKAGDKPYLSSCGRAVIRARDPHQPLVSKQPLCTLLVWQPFHKSDLCDAEELFSTSFKADLGVSRSFPHEIALKRREEDATRRLCHKGFVSGEANTRLDAEANDGQPCLGFISDWLQRRST